MKTQSWIAALTCCALIAASASAQPKKDAKGGPPAKDAKAAPAKSPGDVARDDFNKVRNEQGGKFDQARFEKVIKPGVAFLEQYPTHGSAPAVVRDLAGWIDNVKLDRKTQGALRSAYLSQLKYVLLNERYKEGLSEDAKAALAALDVAVADAELREAPSRQAVGDLREKINGLAELPKSSRFLPDREISYYQITNVLEGAEKGEAQLRKLVTHADKGVADAARRELNLVELRKDPVGWKFTGVDGKEFDFAQYRGKIIAVYFWSTTNRDIAKQIEMVSRVHSDFKKKGVEVVSVSYDKNEDRAKLEKFIKDNGIKFPVHFDGTGAKNEFGTKLNYTSAPKLAIFDQKGVLAYSDLQANQLEPAVKKMLEPPPKKKA